jgi:hypothetical protein
MAFEDHQFKKGMDKVPGSGRKVGTRNRLSHAFLEAFAADFEQHGADIIKIVRIEKPHEYLKTAAYLMPKTFDPDIPSLIVVNTGVPRNEDSIVPAKPRAPLLAHDELLRLSNPTPKDESENA